MRTIQVIGACHPDVLRPALAQVRSRWPRDRVLAVCLADTYDACLSGGWADEALLVHDAETLRCAVQAVRAEDVAATVLAYAGGGSSYLKMVLASLRLRAGALFVTGRTEDLTDCRSPLEWVSEVTGWWLPAMMASGARAAGLPAAIVVPFLVAAWLLRTVFYPFLLAWMGMRALWIGLGAWLRYRRSARQARTEGSL